MRRVSERRRFTGGLGFVAGGPVDGAGAEILNTRTLNAITATASTSLAPNLASQTGRPAAPPGMRSF
jgi:hypothetical protein